MKSKLFILSILIGIFSIQNAIAQKKEGKYIDPREAAKTIIKEKIEELEKERSKYVEQEKKALTAEVERINKAISDKICTAEQGEESKNKIAESYAKRLNTYNAMIDARIAYAEVSPINLTSEFSLDTSPNGVSWQLDNSGNRFRRYATTSISFPLSIGDVNLRGNGSENLSTNDRKSNLVSIGPSVRHILDKNNRFRFEYGLHIQTLQSQLDNNQIFVPNGETTQVGDLGRHVKWAIFSQTQLILPVHLEIGGARKIEYEDGRIRFDTSKSLKFGFGGYIGTNLSSRLAIKEKINGRTVKTTVRDGFDNNVFLYGLDAYVGYGGYALFANIPLNDVFKSGSVNAQYFSIGLRFQ